jgi:hypothetical protein
VLCEEAAAGLDPGPHAVEAEPDLVADHVFGCGHQRDLE